MSNIFYKSEITIEVTYVDTPFFQFKILVGCIIPSPEPLPLVCSPESAKHEYICFQHACRRRDFSIRSPFSIFVTEFTWMYSSMLFSILYKCQSVCSPFLSM